MRISEKKTILRLDKEVTLQLSEAELRIDEQEGVETKGQVGLAYCINALTLDFITAHNSDTYEPNEVHGDITLNLSGCYFEENTLVQVLFFYEDIRLI